MLIRLVNHFIDNPNRIDKLICIKGLPEDWITRATRFGGRELIKPWEPDVETNIPRDAQHLAEPMEIVQIFPPVEKGGQYTVDHKKIRAVRFDYVTEAGQTMWDQIERYMERTVPRDQMVPKPVLVAPDHKSAYNPHEARRTVRGSLELRPVDGIPVVDLRRPDQVQQEQPVREVTVLVRPEQAQAAPIVSALSCKQCTKTFEKQQALRMHVMKAHPNKQPVAA